MHDLKGSYKLAMKPNILPKVVQNGLKNKKVEVSEQQSQSLDLNLIKNGGELKKKKRKQSLQTYSVPLIEGGMIEKIKCAPCNV